MEIIGLKTSSVNQNYYNQNLQTPEFVGSLITYPIDYVHPKCLPCDGFVLKKIDYEQLFSVIGTKFNDGTEDTDEFRIPDYNISKRFLQPGMDASTKIAAGLPNITGTFGVGDSSGTSTSGVFYTISGSRWNEGGGSKGSNPDIGFNASRSSSIYGKSSTVQPPSQIVHICIRYK